MRRSPKRSLVVWKALTCTRGHGGWALGVNIQLSSLNFETITRGEFSQLADYCLTLKISASTRTSEGTFRFTETILPLLQMADRFLQLGPPPFSPLLLFILLSNKYLELVRCRRKFPQFNPSEKTASLLCSLFLNMLRDVAVNCTSSRSLSLSLLLPRKKKKDWHPHTHSETQHCSWMGYITVYCSTEWENKLKNTVHGTRPLSFYSKQLSSLLISTFLFPNHVFCHHILEWHCKATALPLNSPLLLHAVCATKIA